MHFQMSRFGLSAVGLALLSLAGCGSSGRPNALGTSEFVFLAGGGVVPQSQQYLFTATQQLTRHCMSAKGFRYIPAQLASLPKRAVTDNELTANGKAPSEATQLEERERSGYGIYESFAPSAQGAEENAPPANDAYVRSLPAAQQARYMRALEGDPSQHATASPPGGPAYTYVTGGCLGQVDAELYGSPRIANSIVTTPQAIRAQLVAATESDSAVVAAKLGWSRCLAQATGRTFANPPAVESWLSHEYARTGPSASLRRLEITLAVADTRCAYSSRLAQIYAATFRRRADHLSPALQGSLLTMLEHERSATRRAQTILTSGR